MQNLFACFNPKTVKNLLDEISLLNKEIIDLKRLVAKRTEDSKMQLDGIEERYHVREKDNKIAIIVSQPGWACRDKYDYWYVSIEILPDETSVWKHRDGSTSSRGGMPKKVAMEVALEFYQREAIKKGPSK